MAKKTVNVERIGQHSGHPITSAPVPVAESLRKKNIPYYVHDNGTIIQSTVDKDGVNKQVFMKSNQAPSFGMIVNGQDSTAVKYNPELDYTTRKYKPGTQEFKEIAEKTTIYGVPLATYDEAVANLAEVKNQTQHLQPGGEIVKAWKGRKLFGQMSNEDVQAIRSGTYRKSYTDEFGNKIEVKPVVWKNGSIGNGLVYQAVTPQNDTLYNTVGFDLEPSDTPGYQTVVPWGGTYTHDYDDNSNNWERSETELVKRLSVPDIRQQYGPVGNEPPMEVMQEGGEMPSNAGMSFLENLPYGRHNVDKHNKLVEMGKRFGNMIPGSTKPVPLPNKHQPDVPPVKMPMQKQDSSDIKPIPMPIHSGQSNDQMPIHENNKFVIPQKMYQEGGEISSNDQQQQLFVAIITDMAKTLGVEPSQELAEAVLTAFENNDDSQGLLTLFTQTKNKFMNETGLFREGGKMSAFIEKFKCGGKSPKKKTSKKQEGGEVEGAAGYITTPVNDRRARREWRRNNDATRAEARARQNELTDNLMGMGGISRKQARNSAAAMMMDPQRFMGESNRSYDLGAGPAASVNVEAPQMGTPGSLEHNYDNFDFNTAFGRARRTGEDTFTWRGKEYTTELAQPQTSTPDIASQSAGGVYPEYYRNNLQNAGAEWEWGKRFRQRRAERQAAKQAARQGRM